MKHTYLCIVFIMFSSTIFSQVPEMFNYQAIIKNSSNVLIQNETISIRISILQGSETGTVVYSETHSITTDDNGLFSLNIGAGSTTDVFSAIDWGSNSFYIKSEIDTMGGTNYTIFGANKLLSVPYALYAKSTSALDANINGVTDIQIPINNVISSSSFVMLDSDINTLYGYSGNTGTWSTQIVTEFFSSSTIQASKGNFIMLDSDANTLYAFNGNTGSWSSQITSEFFSASTIQTSNGNFIMFDSDLNSLYSYNGNTGVWSTQTTSEFFSTSTIQTSNNNYLAFDSDTNTLYAYSNSTGNWSSQITSEFFSTSTIQSSNGNFIMFDSDVNTLYAFSGQSGTWSSQITSEFFSTSTINVSGN
ncbi:hypothetical protein [uncultured Lacinutrix sp.]|uniref:hypothetical protein n=1 Tax=uncultured Lacinutrix sp. TaxID=574032 RepID=UPI00260C2D44|nr:hypothetical protein [uncultured Lacinutrix sp.]